MVIIAIEIILYTVMAAMIRQLTQIKGLWPALAFGLVFTIITELPGEWIVLPLLFLLLLVPCLLQWGVPVYVAAGLALVPSLGLAWTMHHYDQPLALGSSIALPPGLGAAVPGLLGK